MNLNKNNLVKSLNDFSFEMKSPVYDLIKVSIEIVNQEVMQCNFNDLDFMKFNTKFDISRKILSDSTKVSF